ncbi:STM3941 family protein [Microvirga sp. W0021]|uniref:STM3941 family protein n=1 Tax=Hohaiivirga grylli TaxID=3133970 RepID=A0ABV0BKP4_9HYPH
MIDTSKTLTFKSSPKQLILAMIGCDVFILLGILMGLNVFEPSLGLSESPDFLIGYIGAALFFLFSLLIMRRLLTSNGKDVITISPAGIIDTRIAASIIPWQAILNISTWEYQRQKIIVLTVDPLFEQKLSLTRMARMTRTANARLGADGLCITAAGLKTSYDELFGLIVAYRKDRR